MSFSKIILLFIILFFCKKISLAGIYGVPCYYCHFKPEYSTCLGCHGGGSSKVGYIGTVAVPKVLHTDSSGDLAGGNFAYITGAKQGLGNPNRRGHNVIDLGQSYKESEENFFYPPGTVHSNYFTSDWRNLLTCSGYHGCHGYRKQGDPSYTGFYALYGSHHNNISGALNNPDSPKNSYRFLYGVKGYEIGDWENRNPSSHNEYFGSTQPLNVLECNSCHEGSYIKPKNNTISGFCATCHGNFHGENFTGSRSPWLRHPTDRLLPNAHPYNKYTLYDVNVPIARTIVPSAPSSIVSPGQDVVMCLSCHYAHAGPYPSMLRWDYNLVSGNNKIGCKVCHEDK
ncbi:MAG: cytochrome c3 family protein [candidate division WOR-3 bacterium]